MFSRGLTGITIGLAAFVVVVTAVVAVVLVRQWEPASEAVEARISESAHVYDPATSDLADDLTGYLYRPATPRDAGSVPVIVLIHGGGWLKGPDA